MTKFENIREDVYTLVGKDNLRVTFWNLTAIFSGLVLFNMSGI